jgi:hypothetical protein
MPATAYAQCPVDMAASASASIRHMCLLWASPTLSPDPEIASAPQTISSLPLSPMPQSQPHAPLASIWSDIHRLCDPVELQKFLDRSWLAPAPYGSASSSAPNTPLQTPSSLPLLSILRPFLSEPPQSPSSSCSHVRAPPRGVTPAVLRRLQVFAVLTVRLMASAPTKALFHLNSNSPATSAADRRAILTLSVSRVAPLLLALLFTRQYDLLFELASAWAHRERQQAHSPGFVALPLPMWSLLVSYFSHHQRTVGAMAPAAWLWQHMLWRCSDQGLEVTSVRSSLAQRVCTVV